MKRFLFEVIALFAGIILLCGCGVIEENYLPDDHGGTVEIENSAAHEAAPVELPAAKPHADAVNIADGAENDVPAIECGAEVNGGSYAYTVNNVYARGGYYTVRVVGEMLGGTLGKFRLVLSKDGAELDSLALDVPDGDDFMIMDSVADGPAYGCGVISNMRDFGAEDYPDIIQLDFYKENELEVPQYGRYFAIFDNKITELAVYENGVETAPRGTHLEPRGAGRMVQHLCVYTPSGQSLMVEKYEYIFDIEKRRLNKKKVDFLGWNVD